MRGNFNTTLDKSIVNELVAFAGELLQERLNQIISLAVFSQVDNIWLDYVNKRFHLVVCQELQYLLDSVNTVCIFVRSKATVHAQKNVRIWHANVTILGAIFVTIAWRCCLSQYFINLGTKYCP